MATFRLSVLDALNTFTGETLTDDSSSVNTHFDVIVTAKTTNDFFIKTVDNTGTALTGVTISIDGSSAGSTDANGYLHLNKATGVYSISASKTNYDTISDSIAHTDTEITGTYIKMYPYTFNRIVVKPADNTITKIYEGQTGENTAVVIDRSSISSSEPTLSDESTGKTEQDIFDDFIAAFSGSNTTDKIVYKPSTKVTRRAYSIAGKRNFSADTRDARSTASNYRGRNRTEKQIVDNFHEVFTGSELPPEYVSSGLVSYWTFAEDKVTKDGSNKVSAVEDTVGSNNGTQVTASKQPTWSSTDDDHIQFDGSDDYIDCGNPASLQLTDAISVSMWVKFAGGSKCGASKEGFSGSGGRGWALWASYYGGNNPQFVIWNGNTAYHNGTSATVVNDGDWHQIVGVYEPSVAIRMYVDGSLSEENTTSIPASMNDISDNLILGRFTPTFYLGYNFNGNMDEVMIYSKALSSSEITKNFDIQKTNYGL